MCMCTHVIFKAVDMVHSWVFPAFPLHLEQNLNPQALPISSPALPSPPSANTQAPSPTRTFRSIHVQTLLKPFWSLCKHSATKGAEMSFLSKTAPTCPALASYLCYFPVTRHYLHGCTCLFCQRTMGLPLYLKSNRTTELIAHNNKDEPRLVRRSS